MKKNYIAYLQEYEAKTSSFSKQDKYRKKFIKTVYCSDKENHNPNIPRHSSSKKKPKTKDKGSNNKKQQQKNHNDSRQPIEFRQMQQLSPSKPRLTTKTPTNKDKQNHILELRIKKTHLQRTLCSKHQEQRQKCTGYYNYIKQAIEEQQLFALDYIDQVFYNAKTKMDELSDQLQKYYNKGIQPVCPSIQIELATVVLDEKIFQSLRERVQQLSIFNIAALLQEQEVPNRGTLLYPIKYEQGNEWFEGQSFAIKGPGVFHEQASSILEGISPTFKQI